MKTKTLLFLCACLLVACSGDGGAADLATQPDLGPARAPCGPLLAGEPWSDGVLEAEPGYAEALDALDLTGVPDPLEYGTESLVVQAIVNYVLGTPGETSLSRAQAAQIGEPARAVLAARASGGDELDVAFLRRGLQHFYRCSQPIPVSLDALHARYGDHRTWPQTDIACSRPKNGPRRLFENPELGLFVAETIVGGELRETEVLFMGHRDDGQLDFAAYTPAGELTDRSTFATASGGDVTSGVPFTCMACHLNTARTRYDDPNPTGTGAGCK